MSGYPQQPGWGGHHSHTNSDNPPFLGQHQAPLPPPLPSQAYHQPTGTTNDEANNTSSTNKDLQRRARACEHCRHLKVRCVNNSDDPAEPCIRCVKANRECIYHFGPRKRQKKADKVAALEKKLEYLTNQIQTGSNGQSTESTATNSGPATVASATTTPVISASAASSSAQSQPQGQPKQYPEPSSGPRSSQSDPSPSGSTPGNAAKRRKHLQDTKHPSVNGTPEDMHFDKIPGVNKYSGINTEALRQDMMENWRKINEKSARRLELLESAPVSKTPSIDDDVVAQGIITLEEAQERLGLYKKLYEQFPLVAVQEIDNIERFREETPLLFLSIMSTSSLLVTDREKSETCLILHNNATEAVIYEAMMVGSKTFEILQCLVLMTFWYNEPELQHQQKAHLLSNLAIGVASDLGINGMTVTSSNNNVRYEKIIRPEVLVDPKTIECRKMWLTVYCSAVNMSIVVRRPLHMLWTKYTEECCELVEKSTELNDSEKVVASFARMSHIFEDISEALYKRDSAQSPPDVSDCRTRYLMNYFENSLTRMFETGTVKRLEPYFHGIQIYLHQAALYVPFDPAVGRSPFSDFSLAVNKLKLSVDVSRCIFWCYSSAAEILDQVGGIAAEEFTSLPFFTYTRMIFAASMMLKVRALCITNPELQQAMQLDDEKSLKKLFLVKAKFEQASEMYPFANALNSANFVLKLLMCHFDRSLYYIFEGYKTQQRSSNTQEGQEHANTNTKANNGSGKNYPGSPLDVLSSVAESHGQPGQGQQQQAVQPPQQQEQQQQLPIPLQHQQPQQQQQMPPPGMQQPQQPPQYEDELPVWLMADDFWKDLVPNVEAFTGYEVM